MEEIGQDGGVMNVRRGRHYGMNDLGLAIDPDRGLYPLSGVHAKRPLIALLGLMPVRIAFPLLVLGG